MAKPENKPARLSCGVKTEISVVIAAWNSWRFLEHCLKSLVRNNSVRREIIVVDNASHDETPARIKEHYPECQLLENNRNVGHVSAVNQGIKQAQSDYIMILDADTVLPAAALSQIVEFMSANSTASIVAPRLVNADGTIQETARSFPRFLNAVFGRQSYLTRIFPNNRFVQDYLMRKYRDQQEHFEVHWVSSGCMVFRKELVERIGLWDTNYRGYWVDADWCMRAKQAGLRIFCLPSVRVIHHEQHRPGRKKEPFRIIHFHRGVYRFFRKHYSAGFLDPRLALVFLFLILRATILLVGNVFLPDISPQRINP